MVPSGGSLFDLSPGENSLYIDNHFLECSQCKQRCWIVDTPVLGICPLRGVEVIQNTFDIRATLGATPHEPFKLFHTADEAPRTQMDVDDAEAAE